MQKLVHSFLYTLILSLSLYSGKASAEVATILSQKGLCVVEGTVSNFTINCRQNFTYFHLGYIRAGNGLHLHGRINNELMDIDVERTGPNTAKGRAGRTTTFQMLLSDGTFDVIEIF